MKGRKKAKARRATGAAVILIIVIVIITVLLTAKSIAAGTSEKHEDRTKYYNSIMIEAGDSLWSIAEEYITVEYESIDDYVKEVVQMNHLSDPDHIEYGNCIIVPYYQ